MPQPKESHNVKRMFNNLWRRAKSSVIRDPESSVITLNRGSYRVDIRDAFLISQEGGDSRGLELYYNLITDPTVFVANERLTTLVYNMERKLKPGGDSEKDKQCYDFVKEQLKLRKHALRKAIDNAVLAHILGVTWSEIIWYAEDGHITFDVLPADSRRIAFSLEVSDDERREYYQPRIKTDLNLYPGEPVPDRRFIIQTYYTVPIDSPYGLGVGQQIYWLFEFKKAAMELWNQISSRHAGPIVQGTVPDNTDETLVDEFYDSLVSMAQNATFVTPNDFGLVIQNADTRNADSLIKGLIDYCDQKIREVILGESSSGASTLKPGLAGAARDARAITLQKAKRLSDDINHTLNSTLIKWLANKNYQGAKPPYLITENTDNEQLSAFVNNAVTLAQLGYEIDPKFIEEKTGYPQKPKVTGLGDAIEEPPELGAQDSYIDSRTVSGLNKTEK